MNVGTGFGWKMLGLVAGFGVVLYLLGPVLTPFVTAAMFAYLFDPLADRLEKMRLSRSLSVCIVFTGMLLAFVLLLFLVVPFLESQVNALLHQLPQWLNWLRTDGAAWLQTHFGLAPDFLETDKLISMLQENWHAAGGVAATVVGQISKSGLAIIGWIAHLLLIPVVTFYLLRDWDILVERIDELLPRSIEPTIAKLARESDQVLGAFVRGQVSVMLVMGVVYGLGLWLAGLGVGPLIGLFAGLISFVPYLGAILGVLAGVAAALLQYHDWLHVLLVLGVFGLGHVIESYVLVPRLVGDKIGLHPVAVIFAILAGGELFGFLGVLLALPAASVIAVLVRFAHVHYRASELYRSTHSKQAAAKPPETDAANAMVNPSTGGVVAVAPLGSVIVTVPPPVDGEPKK